MVEKSDSRLLRSGYPYCGLTALIRGHFLPVQETAHLVVAIRNTLMPLMFSPDQSTVSAQCPYRAAFFDGGTGG
jgi:hypothetical protein